MTEDKNETMTEKAEQSKITITLTGRRPVRIEKEDWPIIAKAQDTCWDNQHEHQANRKSIWRLTVRQHEYDGRTIVYAVYTHITQFLNEESYDIRGGELVETTGDEDSMEMIIAAIQSVGAAMEERMPNNGRWGKGRFPELINECVADLPAEDLK